MAANSCMVTYDHYAYACRHEPSAQHREKFSSPALKQEACRICCTSQHACSFSCLAASSLPLQFTLYQCSYQPRLGSRRRSRRRRPKRHRLKLGYLGLRLDLKMLLWLSCLANQVSTIILDAAMYLLLRHASASLLCHTLHYNFEAFSHERH